MEKPKYQSEIATEKHTEVRQTWKPKSKTKTDKSSACPYCNADIKATYAICPHCGRSLTPGKCSFCGAPMKMNAKFCTHCGQNREGIECPECGTLNSRNFCRACNTPLTPMAQQALLAAKNDPAFQAIEAKAKELAELHERIEELRNAAEPASRPELSDADKALLDEYADLLGSIGVYQPKPAGPQVKSKPTTTTSRTETTAQPVKTDTSQRKTYTDNAMSLDDIMKAYKEKAAEMNAAMAALTPPPDFTPEQQRDYYSARKVSTKIQTANLDCYRSCYWVCNLCGCHHNQPSECAEPQLGGTWVHVSVEEYMAANPDKVTVSLRIE